MIIQPTKGANLSITAPLGGSNLGKLSALPGFKKWDGRNLLFRPTGANIRYLIENWPDAEWLFEAKEHKRKFLQSEVEARNTKLMKAEGAPLKADDYEYKRLPMEHQRKAFLLSRDAAAFGLFMEQGTGKTKVIIDNACYLYKKGKIDMLVVIAWPNGVHRNWVDYELPEDMPDWCQYEAQFWSSNLTKSKKSSIDKVLKASGKLKVMTFNVEAFTSEKAKKYITRCVDENRCLVVIDQSASIKNPSAKRTRFLINEISQKAHYRRILDGAPVAEGAGELYSQFKFLDPMIIGHDTWTAFKAEFCEIGYFNNIAGYKNIEKLRSLIDGYSFRVLADECLDLPKRTYKRWSFDLSTEERRIFDDLKKKDIAYFTPDDIDDGVIEENLAMVKNMRLQQITSGWFPEHSEPRTIDNQPSRLIAMEKLLQQAEGKVLIFSRFRADIELLQNMLGDKAVSYAGGISDDDRAAAKYRFMNDDSVLYFIGQPRTAGIGHTLTAAKHVVFYNNDPSLRLREECEKRAHRKGLEKTLSAGESLIIWDLIAKSTQDTKIVSALRLKKEISEEIMNDPTSFFLMENNE